MKRKRRFVALMMLAGFSLHAEERGPAPLFKDLGDRSYPITTNSTEAQRYFDQGLVLSYAFNHPEAIRSFEAAARLDPSAPMPHWGVAFALGPNINAMMMADAAQRARRETSRALELVALSGTEKERALIAAMDKRYGDDPMAERAPFEQAFAQAMREVAKQFPDDVDVQTIFAESLMDTMPWSYWNPDGTPKPDTVEIIDVLKRVLEKAPNHPGANHYYIHAVEASPRPRDGLESARRLESLIPGAGHLVHMPAHIYLRLGMYHRASQVNVRASESDESYASQCGLQGFYPVNYYSHNVHFLWYTTAMEGQSKVSIAAADKAASIVENADLADMPHLASIKTVPRVARLRFGRWTEILAEPMPTSGHPFEVAVARLCRGIAHARKGEISQAREESRLLSSLATSAEAQGLEIPLFPGASLINIADLVLRAEVAGAEGDSETRCAELRKAVKAEDALPYMEPPYWFFPVRHYLGAALLESGKAGNAVRVYREDLRRHPNNGWALFGLTASLRAQGIDVEASKVEERFRKAWRHADTVLTSSRF